MHEHGEQMQSLVETPTSIHPQILLTSLPNHNNNNRHSTNSTELSVTTSEMENIEINLQTHDIVISVRNAHKSYGKVKQIFNSISTITIHKKLLSD
jgi:hypothetical protein